MVKLKEGTFNGVGGDMGLEQSVQRATKGTVGIIGASRKTGYVEEWCLTYHETAEIAKLFRTLTNADKSGNRETQTPHHLKNNVIKRFNESVNDLTSFISRNGNPYTKASTLTISSKDKLKNFVTDVLAEPEVTESRVKYKEFSEGKLKDYRNEVYLQKSKMVTEKVTKYELKPVDYVSPTSSETSRAVKKVRKVKQDCSPYSYDYKTEIW